MGRGELITSVIPDNNESVTRFQSGITRVYKMTQWAL